MKKLSVIVCCLAFMLVLGGCGKEAVNVRTEEEVKTTEAATEEKNKTEEASESKKNEDDADEDESDLSKSEDSKPVDVDELKEKGYSLISDHDYVVIGSKFALEWDDTISVKNEGEFTGVSHNYGEKTTTNEYTGSFGAPSEVENRVYSIDIEESEYSYWKQGTSAVLYDIGTPIHVVPDTVKQYVRSGLYASILDSDYLPCQLLYNDDDDSVYADADYIDTLDVPAGRKNVPDFEDASEGSDVSASGAVTSPFYGIWCYGSKTEADANSFAASVIDKGFDGRVFVTTDWSNLNSEKYYVVTAGIYSTEEDAKAALAGVQSAGYSDAYVKYSGDYQN